MCIRVAGGDGNGDLRMYMGYTDPATGTEYVGPVTKAEYETLVAAESAAEEIPWYARPTQAILDILGNITYRTDDYAIISRDGSLIVDRSTTPTPTPAAPTQAGMFEAIGRVSPIVWLGVGGIVLFTMSRGRR